MTIVVGYLPTPEGKAALERATEESVLRNLPLVVVASQQGGREFGDEEVARFDRELDSVRASLEKAGVQHEVRGLVRGNDPSDDVLAVAEETGAELIVIGLRRRSPVGKLLLGSNAQRILLEADCTVIAVKAAR